MAIVFHEASKTFHLYNKKVSYIVSVLENGGLENLYYGRAIKDRESFGHHHEEMVRSHMCVIVGASVFSFTFCSVTSFFSSFLVDMPNISKAPQPLIPKPKAAD